MAMEFDLIAPDTLVEQNGDSEPVDITASPTRTFFCLMLITDQIEQEVRGFFKDKVYQSVIPRNVRMSEAPSHGKPALIYDMHCAGSKAYIQLASELLKRERKRVKELTAA